MHWKGGGIGVVCIPSEKGIAWVHTQGMLWGCAQGPLKGIVHGLACKPAKSAKKMGCLPEEKFEILQNGSENTKMFCTNQKRPPKSFFFDIRRTT